MVPREIRRDEHASEWRYARELISISDWTEAQGAGALMAGLLRWLAQAQGGSQSSARHRPIPYPYRSVNMEYIIAVAFAVVVGVGIGLLVSRSSSKRDD